MKLEAEKAAKRVYGVRGVADDIQLNLTTKRTDSEIARDAVEELENHLLIPSDKIKVTVRDGWVTLEGEVRWHFQWKLAESAVRKLVGVMGITNNIRLKPSVSPAKVKEQIEAALKRSAELDARRGSVAKLAKLSGRVESHADHSDQSVQMAPLPGRSDSPMRSLVSTISLGQRTCVRSPGGTRRGC
jgi:osmotically-inducible protein OsmY